MSVEELAKKYCEGSSFEDACMEKPAYIAGYHQAEKDLELTWKDMKLIWNITDEMDNMPEEEFYQEVLKRFNKEKRNMINQCLNRGFY